jgi:hypothetical protein
MEVVGVEKLQEVSKLVCFLCCLRANNIGIWMKSTCFFCFACTSSSSSSSSCNGGCWCGEITRSLEVGMFSLLLACKQYWNLDEGYMLFFLCLYFFFFFFFLSWMLLEIFASLEFGMFLCLCANIQIWRRLVISCSACVSFSSRHGG